MIFFFSTFYLLSLSQVSKGLIGKIKVRDAIETRILCLFSSALHHASSIWYQVGTNKILVLEQVQGDTLSVA